MSKLIDVYPKEIEFHVNRIKILITKYKKREERIKAVRNLGYHVVEYGYMSKASKHGQLEFFPKKNEYRLSISRHSGHLYRQFDYVIIRK